MQISSNLADFFAAVDFAMCTAAAVLQCRTSPRAKSMRGRMLLSTSSENRTKIM